MFKKIFVFLLIFISVECELAGNFGNCSNVLNGFQIGQNIFEKEDEHGELLVRSGFTVKRGEPAAGFFFDSPPEGVILKNYLGTDSALRGVQYLADNILKDDLNKVRQTRGEFNQILRNISSCVPKSDRCQQVPEFQCNQTDKYRSYNGSCNNLNIPIRGASQTPFSRLVDAFYHDGVLEVRKNAEGYDLISARTIVDKIFTEEHRTQVPRGFIPNMQFLMFGQYITHDVAGQVNMHHRAGIQNGSRCCSSDYKTILPQSQLHYACLPIQIPYNDKFYKSQNLRCKNFIRSQPVFPNDCKLSAAQQVSVVSHHIDGSPIYGGSDEQARSLRQLVGGLLAINQNEVLMENGACRPLGACYTSGDNRVNQTPQLAIQHSYFVRLHNAIANELTQINPHWDDERLFQEARRINNALYQHIIYTEYVPILLDETISCHGDSCNYDPEIDSSTLNDYTTAVNRYLHVFVPNTFNFYNKDGYITFQRNLSDSIGKSQILETNYVDVSIGLMLQSINLLGFSDEIRNKVFGSIDLISIDIQRGRDHGLSPYWKYREICGLPSFYSFDDLYPIISKKNIEYLKTVYKYPRDIDLYVAGALEEDDGGLFGPTFKCIAKEQFLRYKYGDRYFYTHKNNPYPFNKHQLNEIKSFSFAKLICTITDFKRVALKGFYVPSKRNPMIDCSKLKSLNLNEWKEE